VQKTIARQAARDLIREKKQIPRLPSLSLWLPSE